MSRLLRVYQYLAPAILAPLSFYLWWREYGNLPQVFVAWLIPILWAYIVPGIGTNICKVWEFDVRWKLGRFRPHHGFVFGSATATIAWLIHGEPATSVGDIGRFALVMCSVLGFWNLLYEIKALRAGLLKVYNQPWAMGLGPEAIALDYSPWFFGGYGFAYGGVIGMVEYYAAQHGALGVVAAVAFLGAGLALTIGLPVIGFMNHSQRTHGHSGTRPIARNSQ
jgi:hypothetical protein